LLLLVFAVKIREPSGATAMPLASFTPNVQDTV
jgi:hypothetical protein